MGLIHRRTSGREDLADAYDRYLTFENGRGRRTVREVQTVIQAAGLAYEEAGTSFWHSIRADWLAGEQDLAPFEDAPGANQEYRDIASLRGLLPACIYCGLPPRDPN